MCIRDRSNVADWYELFDVLVMTSRVEGVSNVVIESQYSGTPVVAPDVGGLSEAINDKISGYLLQDHSVSNFTHVICNIISNEKLLNSLSVNAKSYAIDKFSIETMVKKYLGIYSSPFQKENINLNRNVDQKAISSVQAVA